MIPEVKFKLKRKSKLYLILTTITLLLFFVGFGAILIGAKYIDDFEVVTRIIYASAVFTTIPLMFIFSIMGTKTENKLKRYMNNIRLYRERVVTLEIFRLLSERNFKKASDYYDSTNWVTPDVQFFLSGHITGVRLSSYNNDEVEMSMNKIAKIKKAMNPDIMKFK